MPYHSATCTNHHVMRAHRRRSGRANGVVPAALTRGVRGLHEELAVDALAANNDVANSLLSALGRTPDRLLDDLDGKSHSGFSESSLEEGGCHSFLGSQVTDAVDLQRQLTQVSQTPQASQGLVPVPPPPPPGSQTRQASQKAP